MPEKIKRLEPLKPTLRELYLKSGNLCAFPNCKQIMMDVDGSFVGQICHIEAAEKGGQRFNSDMSNEDRRRVSNLMLMCYTHHVKTNDTSKYPANVLRDIKAAHESKFSNPENSMLDKLRDSTAILAPVYPNNLNRINSVLEFELEGWQLQESLRELKQFVEKLHKVPVPVRQFCFEVAARYCRLTDINTPPSFTENISVSVLDFRDSFGISEEVIQARCSQMEQYSIGYLDLEPNHEHEATIILRPLKSGWTIWSDIAMFCMNDNHDLAKIWHYLDFSILDDIQQTPTA